MQMKKVLSILLVAVMLISVIPFTANAADVSFTKVTSAGDITTDNIGTCTAEDAKAWALANWDVAHDYAHDTHLAFYSNTGELNVVLVDYGMNEHSFSRNFDYCIYTSYSIFDLKTWYADGDAIFFCTAAAPAPGEPAEGAAEDGPLVGTVIKIGDTLTLDGDYFEFAPGLKTSTTADFELYQMSYNEDFNAWLFTFTPNDVVFLVEGDETPKPDGFYVSGGNGTESHPYTFALHYGPAPTTYTITWKSDANTVIDTTQVEEGATPTHAAPADYEDADYTYTFAGWTPEVAAVTGDVTYTATYTATAKIQPVAEVNGTGYATLEEAIAAANAGDTVKLLDDIDFTETYAKRASHYLDISGLTIDLNDHTITTYTNGVLWFGNDATIKNGSFVGLSDDQNRDYAITIYGKEAGYLEQTQTVASSNITLENLDVTGGISAWKAQNVVIKNCDVAANNYYAVWADVDNTTVVIESGSFTSNCVKTNGVIGAAYQDTNSTIAVKGGDFTVPAKKNIVLKSTTADQVNISGGTFNVVVPVKYCADGFVPVTEPNAQGKYEVTEAQNGYSLTIAEKIDVNFTISTDSYGAEGGTIVVNGVDAENESAVKSEKTFDIGSLPTVTSGAYDGNVIVSLEVAPAQLAEVFTLSVYDASGTFKGKVESSVYNYANAMKADAKYGELMTALINYGALAKDYFNYDGAEITPAEGYNTDLTTDEKNELISRRAAGLTTGNASFDGMVYFAKVEPEFKFYFANTNVGEAQLGADSEGLSVNLTKTDNGVAAKVTGFKASDFGKTFTVTVDGTTLTINGYAYIASALKSDSLKSLATGLFRYAQAAEAVA